MTIASYGTKRDLTRSTNSTPVSALSRVLAVDAERRRGTRNSGPPRLPLGPGTSGDSATSDWRSRWSSERPVSRSPFRAPPDPVWTGDRGVGRLPRCH